MPRFNRSSPNLLNARPGVVKERHYRTCVVNGGARINFKAGSGRMSYMDVLQNNSALKEPKSEVFYDKTLSFSPNEDDIYLYNKSFTGKIMNPGLEIDLKKIFMEDGVFSIRVTMLGLNLCLLEELVGGEVESFIEERRGC